MRKKAKIVTTLVIVAMMCLFSVSIAQAQGKEGAGMGYFMYGGSKIGINTLNASLEDKGYAKLSDNFISTGGGGQGIIGKLIIGGEGHGLGGKQTTSGSYKSSLSAGYGFFNLGYLIYSTGHLNVYPLLGLGAGGITLKILETGTAPSFDDILDDPKRGVELSTGGFLLNLALGTEYFLILGRDERGEGGLVFGLRIGYTLAPFKRDWEMDGEYISDGPKMGITGPYIRLMIGGGGMSKK